MINFILKHPRAHDEMLGAIPQFLSADDPRPAAEQFNERYSHGGGWAPMSGWTMLEDGSIKYPGDPAYPVLASAQFGREVVLVYQYAWVAIVQPDGTFEISRMD